MQILSRKANIRAEMLENPDINVIGINRDSAKRVLKYFFTANILQKCLTLAHAATLLPQAVRVPDELLSHVLNGNVVGIPDVWVVQAPNRQHL